MITRENINEIYRKFRKAPASVDDLNIAALFDETAIHHDIMIDPEENTITFGSVEEGSPFKTIDLKRVHAILAFDEWVAIVMHSSILFLNRQSPRTAIDIKPVERTLTERIGSLFRTSMAC